MQTASPEQVSSDVKEKVFSQLQPHLVKQFGYVIDTVYREKQSGKVCDWRDEFYSEDCRKAFDEIADANPSLVENFDPANWYTLAGMVKHRMNEIHMQHNETC